MGNGLSVIQYTHSTITNGTPEQINKRTLARLIKEKMIIKERITFYLNEIRKNENSRNMLSLQKLTILDKYQTYKHHDTINKQEYNAYCLKLEKNARDILQQERNLIRSY